MHIRIGTRKSNLALLQTDIFIKTLQSKIEFSYEIIPIKTSGDKILDKPLYDIGGKALFLKELEEALLKNEIDCAIHSMKDVPAILPNNLKIAAMLKRDRPEDVLISNISNNIENLPPKARIGTCSVRRKAQILRIRPDIEIVPIRGNIETRIEKFKNENLDGIILALAGINRLNLYNESCHIIPTNKMIPSVGQGAIGIEIRSDDLKLQKICDIINDVPTWSTVMAERGFLEYLNGDCRTPLAAFAEFISEYEIKAHYMLAGNNLEFYKTSTKTSTINNAYQMGAEAAKELSSS